MSRDGALRVDWPFLLVGDARYRRVGWALVTGPIVTRAHHVQLAALSDEGIRFVGMASYLRFPRLELDREHDARDYGMLCEAWCHCFRDPDRYLPAGAPQRLLPLSDFTDPRRVVPRDGRAGRPAERREFVYVGASEAWKKRAKGWRLAGRLLPGLCEELDLHALVVGTPDAELAPSPRVTFVEHLPWDDFLSRLAGACFLFAPNALDPSPRVLAEALCLDVPILVQRAILGGWHYVNPFTGAFFDGEHDVCAAARRCLAASLRPRTWFQANHGPYWAGRALLALLRDIDVSIEECSHLVVAASLS